MDDGWLTYDTFAPLVGAEFSVRREGAGPVQVTLVEAENTGRPGGVGAGGHIRTQFSLTFRGPAGAPLEQGTYVVAGEQLGEQAIFLVPVRADADGRYYEAVFA